MIRGCRSNEGPVFAAAVSATVIRERLLGAVSRPDEMSRVPTLATPDYKLIGIDRDWLIHKLPYEPVEVPREHLPDPESENIPSIITQQETAVDLERCWTDTGIGRVSLGCTQSRRF